MFALISCVYASFKVHKVHSQGGKDGASEAKLIPFEIVTGIPLIQKLLRPISFY